MTRINVIPPEQLTDQHLFAEYRELPRMAAYTAKAAPFVIIPARYTLGPGHMKFFLNKRTWLTNRHKSLIAELLRRRYNLSSTEKLEIPVTNFGDDIGWQPSSKDTWLNLERLQERFSEKPEWYRYYGQAVSSTFYMKHLSYV